MSQSPSGIATTTSMTDVHIAVCRDKVPEASGLLRLDGCFLSSGKSIISFIRYPVLDIRLNNIKAIQVLIKNGISNKCLENIIAANIKEFFIQWGIRSDIMRYFNIYLFYNIM